MGSGDIINMMSDVIVQTTSLSLMVPSPEGFITAGAGQAIGASLKILYELFRVKYDWNDQENRNKFIRVNCAFYDMKQEMNNSGLLNIKSASFTPEIINKKEFNKLLKKNIEELELQLGKLLVQQEIKKMGFLGTFMGMKEVNLENLDKILRFAEGLS